MAGRKRKPGPRYPSGQLRRAGPDRGEAGAASSRAYLAQGGTPELAAYPLGVMCAVGDISDGERRAGCRYAWLHSVRFGRVTLSARAWDDAPAASPRAFSDEARASLEDALREADAALDAAGGARVRAIVEWLAVHERTPRWMTPRIPAPSDLRDGVRAKRGLRALAALWNDRGGERE